MMSSVRVAEDAIGSQFERRCELAVAEASRLLGMAGPETTGSEALPDAIATVTTRLAEIDRGGDWREQVETHEDALERLRERYAARFDALSEAELAVAALRDVTSRSEILTRAPRELCEHSQLDRVVLSLVQDGFISAQAIHFREDPVGGSKTLEALRSNAARLEHPLVETEVLRRRRATIVTEAQSHPRVHRPTARIMGWSSYIAAPLVVEGEAIGAIHADTGTGGRPLDVLDGDVLWTFALGVADAYETASLRRAMRRQREQTRQFIEWLGARSIELSDAAIELIPERPSAPDPPGKLEITARGPDDDRLVFEDLLTRRELDVLRLLARGESNGAIAAQLVIAEATVKFHIANLLRKLHASNRAEAVARYHRLVRVRGGDG